MANKVLYGIKNVHVASVTLATDTQTGTVTATFGTPQAMPGAVSISIEQEGEQSVKYADNTAYWVGVANNGYSGTLEMALIPDFFFTSYLGQTADTNGNIVERSTDNPAYFALQFEFDGDEQAQRHTLFYVKASRPNLESETTEDTIEPGNEAIEFTAIPLPDGSDVIKAKSTTESANYDTWYTTITVPQF